MLTLDAVRTAVLSDQPWSRLDELVRAELAQGQTTRQIYKSLMSLADEVDATEGLTEDGSDAFGDTLDALTGYCHPDCKYIDPPNVAIPSEEEVAQLPRWARVAFAARCARRVLPLYYLLRDPTMRQIEKLDLQWVLDETENSAALAHPQRGVISGYEDTAALTYIDGDTRDQAASAAADAVAYAAAEAADDNRPTRAFITANHAAASGQVITSITRFIRRDFDYLARLAEWQKWDDDTPVPPEVFGPLWPEGPPKGWPPVTDAPPRTDLVIEAFARERATEQMIEDDIVNLFNALNRYHIARSGMRLTLEEFRSLLPALVPAEA